MVFFAIVIAVLLWGRLRPSQLTEPAAPVSHTTRARLRLPKGVKLGLGRGPVLALSPDERAVVFRAEANGVVQLYRQPLDHFDAVAIAGTRGAIDPFLSPDGKSVGFFAEGKLKTIPIDGGVAVTLADAPNPRGSVWGADNVIYLTPRNNTGVWRVPASGGKLEPVTTLADGQLSHRWPSIVPGGSALLYSVWLDTGWETASLVWHPLDGGASHEILKGGGFGRIVRGADGQNYVAYARADTVMTAPFDLRAGVTTGPATAAIDDVLMNFSGGAHFDVGSNGSLIYVSNEGAQSDREVAWVGRDGVATPVATLPGPTSFFDLSLAPDAARFAYYKRERATLDVWIHDLRNHTSTRVTTQANPTSTDGQMYFSQPSLAWSPDGRYVAYASGAPNTNIFRADPARQGNGDRLTTSPNPQLPASWSPDGKTLAYVEVDPLSGPDIWLVSAGEPSVPPWPFLRTPFAELGPMISPDGRLVAYFSNESGRYEVYLQPFPAGGRASKVSVDGGIYPRWSPSGRELFFISGASFGTMSVASVTPSGTLPPGALRVLFDSRNYNGTFAVAPGATRLLMSIVPPARGVLADISLVLNWVAELAARQP